MIVPANFELSFGIDGAARKCLERGWTVGTVLEGDEGHGPERIVITAIGESHILARGISRGGKSMDDERELPWRLDLRDWKFLGTAPVVHGRFQIVVGAMDQMTDAQRLDVLARYCGGCGRLQPVGRPCQCMNDE